MRRRISTDLKVLVHRLWKSQRLSEQDVARFAFSRATLWRIDKQLREKGFVSNQKPCPGGRRKLQALDVDILNDAVRRKPHIYLDELQELLRIHGVNVSVSTISRQLRRDMLSYRKLKRIALERSDSRIRRFLYRITAFAPEQLVFVDESSFDIRTATRLAGWGRRGNRLAAMTAPRNWDPRFSLVAGLRVPKRLSEPGLVEPCVVEGSFNGDKFFNWMRDLLQSCEVFPGRSSVIVMDNAPIHRRAARMIEDHGCIPVFLPPYSPQFNPIELAFHQIKASIRRRFHSRDQSRRKMSAYDVYVASDVVRGYHAKKFFESDGYTAWEGDEIM